jgi:uncharacterized membrane protein (DUF2068 family)
MWLSEAGHDNLPAIVTDLPAPAAGTAPGRTLRLIIVYKLARGSFALLAAITLAVLVWTGHAASLRDFVTGLRDHATSGVASRVASLVLHLFAPGRIWVAIGALLLDGSVTVLEGWALHHGHAWGRWLVVLLTAALLPFEAFALVHRPRLGRALLLLGNLAVALYLANRARLEHPRRARLSRPQPHEPADPPEV